MITKVFATYDLIYLLEEGFFGFLMLPQPAVGSGTGAAVTHVSLGAPERLD
jgi:hypothetical protein